MIVIILCCFNFRQQHAAPTWLGCQRHLGIVRVTPGLRLFERKLVIAHRLCLRCHRLLSRATNNNWLNIVLWFCAMSYEPVADNTDRRLSVMCNTQMKYIRHKHEGFCWDSIRTLVLARQCWQFRTVGIVYVLITIAHSLQLQWVHISIQATLTFELINTGSGTKMVVLQNHSGVVVSDSAGSIFGTDLGPRR